MPPLSSFFAGLFLLGSGFPKRNFFDTAVLLAVLWREVKNDATWAIHKTNRTAVNFIVDRRMWECLWYGYDLLAQEGNFYLFCWCYPLQDNFNSGRIELRRRRIGGKRIRSVLFHSGFLIHGPREKEKAWSVLCVLSDVVCFAVFIFFSDRVIVDPGFY